MRYKLINTVAIATWRKKYSFKLFVNIKFHFKFLRERMREIKKKRKERNRFRFI